MGNSDTSLYVIKSTALLRLLNTSARWVYFHLVVGAAWVLACFYAGFLVLCFADPLLRSAASLQACLLALALLHVSAAIYHRKSILSRLVLQVMFLNQFLAFIAAPTILLMNGPLPAPLAVSFILIGALTGLAGWKLARNLWSELRAFIAARNFGDDHRSLGGQ